MKDIVTVSVVNFHPIWGEKERNLKRIGEYIESEAKKGADIIVFPELCLTGYDDEDTDGFGLGHGENLQKAVQEKMQSRQAGRDNSRPILGIYRGDHKIEPGLCCVRDE